MGRLPMPVIGGIEFLTVFERTSLKHRRMPHGSKLQEYRSMQMNRLMTRHTRFHATNDLFTIRRRHHRLHVVGHGDDRQQHRDQNQVGAPRREGRMNPILGRDAASTAGVEQSDAQARRSRQPQKIEQ